MFLVNFEMVVFLEDVMNVFLKIFRVINRLNRLSVCSVSRKLGPLFMLPV